jgi:DNA-binding response OmpR family regulator
MDRPEMIKVLMADDEPEILNIMAKKVAQEGFGVITARDGVEAWGKIETENPDVIILDLTMPKMDGFTVLQKLRKNPPTQKWQPVIIVSAQDEYGTIHKSIDLEADHYITKPCRIDEIIRGIRLMVGLIPQRNRDHDRAS